MPGSYARTLVEERPEGVSGWGDVEEKTRETNKGRQRKSKRMTRTEKIIIIQTR